MPLVNVWNPLQWLYENRGVYDYTFQIITICADYIAKNFNLLQPTQIITDPNTQRKSWKFIGVFNVPLQDEKIFIQDPIIELTLDPYNSKTSSGLVPPKPQQLKNKKLVNPIFRIRLYTSNHLDWTNFSMILSHEITHAYRWYSIMIKNGKIPPSEQTERNRYQNIHLSPPYHDDANQPIYDRLVHFILYRSITDEINAFAVETYAYLRRNNVTKANINRHLKNLQGYCGLQYLHFVLEDIQKLPSVKNEQSKKAFNDELNKINQTNNTFAQNYQWLKRRIKDAIDKADKQYKKVLKKYWIETGQEPNNNTNIVKPTVQELQTFKWFNDQITLLTEKYSPIFHEKIL